MPLGAPRGTPLGPPPRLRSLRQAPLGPPRRAPLGKLRVNRVNSRMSNTSPLATASVPLCGIPQTQPGCLNRIPQTRPGCKKRIPQTHLRFQESGQWSRPFFRDSGQPETPRESESRTGTHKTGPANPSGTHTTRLARASGTHKSRRSPNTVPQTHPGRTNREPGCLNRTIHVTKVGVKRLRVLRIFLLWNSG